MLARLEDIPSEMFCATAQKLLQKQSRLEGSTASMAAPVDVKRTYEQEEQSLLNIVSKMGGRRCRCLPHSQNSGWVRNGGNVGIQGYTIWSRQCGHIC